MKVALVILLIVVIYYFPIVLGIQTLFSITSGVYPEGPVGYNNLLKTAWIPDPFTYMWVEVPQTMWGISKFFKGELPLWNPYQGCGIPSMAQIDNGFYNPLKLIFLLFPYISTFNWLIILKIFLAILGAYLFLRKLSFSFWPSIAGSIIFSFSGYFRLYFNQWTSNCAIWIGWFLLLIQYLVEYADIKRIFLLSIVSALIILAGSPEEAVPIFILGLCFFLYEVYQKHGFLFKKVGNLFIKFTLAIIISLFVALPMILDFLILWFNSVQTHSVHGSFYSSMGSQHASSYAIISLVFSWTMFLGSTIKFDYLFKDILPFVGVAGIMLSFLSLGKERRINKLAFFWCIYIFFYLSKIVGAPYINWIYKLPVLGLIVWPKYAATLYFSFGVLSACGFENIVTNKVNLKSFLFCIFSVFGLVLVAYIIDSEKFIKIFSITFPDHDFIQSKLNSLSKDIQNLVLTIIRWIDSLNPYVILCYVFTVGVIFIILICLAKKYYYKKIVIVGLFLSVFFELFIYAPHLMPQKFNPIEKAPYISFLKDEKKIQLERIWGQGGFLMPSYASSYELYDPRAIVALFTKRYYLFFVNTIFSDFQQKRSISYDNPSPYLYLADNYGVLKDKKNILLPRIYRYFDFLGIKYIIGRKAVLDKPAIESAIDYTTPSVINLPQDRFPLIYDQDNVVIYENPMAFPRAFMVFDVKKADNPEEVFEYITNPTFDLRNSAVIEGILPTQLKYQGKSPTVEIISYKTSKIVIKTVTDAPGLLVLTDAYYPGWQAFVDKKKTIIYPVNYAFRGVYVPQGINIITFIYMPVWVYLGFFVSIVVLIIIFIILRIKVNKKTYARKK